MTITKKHLHPNNLNHLINNFDFMSLVTQLSEHCPTCNKVAKTKSIQELNHPKLGVSQLITLECNHLILTKPRALSNYDKLIWDVTNPNCFHDWNKNECLICGAHRLYPFQVIGARLIEQNNGRFLIADDCGLGKTMQALAYLKFNKLISEPFIWVTKAGSKYQHGKEIVRVIDPDSMPQPINSSRDILWPNMNYITSYAGLRNKSPEEFLEMGVKTLILDECQAIKNPDAIQTKAVRRLASEIPQVIALSGTPWKNRGSEYFNILNILDSKLFPERQQFINRWVDTYLGYGGKVVEGGILNPEKFRELTKHIQIRRERIEVLPELPLINRTRNICEVPEHARKAYNKEEDVIRAIMKDAILEGTEGSFDVSRQLNDTFNAMRQIIGISKVPTTVELAQEFLEETDRKLVIFVHHKECGRLIFNQMEKWCNENAFPPVLKLTAEMSSLERGETQDKFNSTKYRLLIASTLASGEALNLQTCADCIMHERQWNPANEEQAEGRFPRIGQKATQINARYMHADNTIDIDLDGIVESKRRAFHSSMNKGKMPVWEEKNIIMELAQRIMNKGKR